MCRRSMLIPGVVVFLLSAMTNVETVAQSSPATGRPGSLLGMDRMGAGVPGGWKTSGENYSWTAETEPGPLGAGAARIEFKGAGVVELSSPACAMPEGMSCAVAVWARSVPAGGSIKIAVRDNDGEESVLFEKSVALTDAWQLATVKGTLSGALKGRYYLRFEARGSDSSVWVDGLWAGEVEGPMDGNWKPATRPAGVVLRPVTPWGLVTGEEPMRVSASVVGVKDKGAMLALRTIHTTGVTADLPSIPLDDSGIWQGEFEVGGDVAKPYGMLRVEATVVSADGKPLSAMSETLLARAPEPVPGPLSESPFGVHVLLREPDVAVAAKLGFKWCRIHDADATTKWGHAEPEPGKWVWQDDKIKMVRSYGLSIVGMLDSAPPWESGTDEKGYFAIYHAPKNVDNWRNYVRQMVGHYAGAIDQWEVWNEPWDMFRFFNGGSPQLYAELLKTAYAEAKAVNPKATIIGIDTYPPFWENAVLSMDTYSSYDLMSWHRYDPTLNGRPGDAVSRVAKRLVEAQAKYGTPKPILCTEGGPDVSVFHGSFFSFADPVMTGDWSDGADRLPRMYLSMLAAGSQRFILYSIHGTTRYGQLTHNIVEPGQLLRPCHLGVAAFAHFVEGAKYEGRLVPVHDVSAHVFSQPNKRAFADAPCTVVALIADGAENEDLPISLPANVRCFDRWANPCVPPSQATRGITYLVATGADQDTLKKALDGKPETGLGREIEALLKATVNSLTQGTPALWTLFSAQSAIAVSGGSEGYVAATRAMLKKDPALTSRFRLPQVTIMNSVDIQDAGEFRLGSIDLTQEANKWTLSFSAVQDGPGNSWRFISLALIPNAPADDAARQVIAGELEVWAKSMREAQIRELYGHLYDGPCALGASTLNGEYFMFNRAEQLMAMMNTAILWGRAQKSEMTCGRIDVAGPVATVLGRWDLQSLAFGSAQYPVAATLVKTDKGWKTIALCTGAAPGAGTGIPIF